MEWVMQVLREWLQLHRLDPLSIAVLFGLSFALGVLHSFTTGHGKSLLLGVLVADSRRLGHAVAMSAVIGLTHIADVIVMSLLSIGIVSYFPPEKTAPFVRRITGSLILLLGLWRVWRYRGRTGSHGAEHDHQGPSGPHGALDRQRREKQNLVTGFLYSLAPCPAAWVMFMACLSMNRAILGFFLLVGFSLGLLVTIAAIGVIIVYSLTSLEGRIPGWVSRRMPQFSGIVLLLLGGWILVGGHFHPY